MLAPTRFPMLLTAAVILAVGSLSYAAEDLPAPGTVFLRDGTSQEGVFVLLEGLREVTWSRDDRGQARTSRPTAEITRVEYTPIPGTERQYVRGIGAFNARNWANTVDPFAETARSSRYAFYRIDSHLKRAEALMRLRRYEEALVDTQAVITRYAEWVYVVDAMELEGRIHLAAGNAEKAVQAYQRMRQAAGRMGGFYGARTIARGAMGEAGILATANKQAEIVTLLRDALGKVPLAVAAAEHGMVAAALGDALLATGATDEARALFTTLRFAPVGAAHRGKAFLELGKMHIAADEVIPAVDALIIAAVMRGGSDEVRAEARRRVRPLLTALGQDSSLDPELQREYRSYLANL